MVAGIKRASASTAYDPAIAMSFLDDAKSHLFQIDGFREMVAESVRSVPDSAVIQALRIGKMLHFDEVSGRWE
jgi:hypothetical protein